MHKTLHNKLTAKHLYEPTPLSGYFKEDDMHTESSAWLTTGLQQEIRLLREAAKDLLQPRPQAVANLLKMAREI